MKPRSSRRTDQKIQFSAPHSPTKPRGSAKLLSDFLISPALRPRTPNSQPQTLQDAPSGHFTVLNGQFYTPGPGTQAKAEKPADSNNDSGGRDASDVSRLADEQRRSEKASMNKSQVDEAEKVEESLRDFIGKIIGYYEKFHVGSSLLPKYERKISKAETLLEVFDLMKEMFEELMQNVLKESRGLLDCSAVSDLEVSGRQLDAIVHEFELEIKAHNFREKELVKLTVSLERGLASKGKEMECMNKKYDEVRVEPGKW